MLTFMRWRDQEGYTGSGFNMDQLMNEYFNYAFTYIEKKVLERVGSVDTHADAFWKGMERRKQMENKDA